MESEKAAAPTRRKDKSINFRVGVRKVVFQVHPSLSIQTEALEELSNIAVSVGEKLSRSAATLIAKDVRTISSAAIQAAVSDVYPGDFRDGALDLINKALKKIENPSKEGTRSVQANLVLSVARSERILRKHAGCLRISAKAAVALAAALEYLIVEIVELAGNAAMSKKKIRISVKHLQEGALNDSDIYSVVGEGIFSGAGVSLIPAVIRRKKPTRKASSEKAPKKTTAKKKASPKKKTASEESPKKKKASPKKKKASPKKKE